MNSKNSKMKKYVITGVTCSGKTTTINALSNKGYTIVTEAARASIDEMIKKGKNVVTWQGNVHKIQKKILNIQLQLEKKAEEQINKQNKKAIFMDRGVPDGIAFYKISNTKLPAKLLKESKAEERNYAKIFFLEAIPYRTDDIRKEPLDVAKKIAGLIYETYAELGYTIINVPLMPVQERVKFIKENL